MLPKLYKRNANGTVNEWQIIVEGDTYYTKYGLVGGSIQSSDVIKCYGKNIGKANETTAEDQALKEATSIYNRKKTMENFVEDIDKVGELAFNPPMLAKVYSKTFTSDIKFVQPKLDGIRCNVSLNGEELESISRRNKPFYSTSFILDELKHSTFFERHPSIHLDGELYNHDLHDDFNRIVSIVKKQNITEDDKANIEKYVRYFVYDLWDDERPNLTYGERHERIKELEGMHYIQVVPTFEVSSAEEVDKYFREFINSGYEGAILRLDKPYEHKRSSNLLKYKEFCDDEFEILAVNLGKSNTIAESITVKLDNGDTCNATLAFRDDECERIWNDRENLIGKVATVSYFGKTQSGSLRFPVVKEIDRTT